MKPKDAKALLTAAVPGWADMTYNEIRQAIQMIPTGRSALRAAWVVANASPAKRVKTNKSSNTTTKPPQEG